MQLFSFNPFILVLILLILISSKNCEAQQEPSKEKQLYYLLSGDTSVKFKYDSIPPSSENNPKDSIIKKLTNQYHYLRDYLPNSYWIGSNFNTQRFSKRNTLDTFSAHSLSLEAGVGWYEVDIETNNIVGYWFVYGGGLGLEYRFPFDKKKTIESQSGLPYRQLYFNARGEAGFGGYLGPLLLCGNLQLGYTTDFLYHYLRPGFGLSLGRLQLGMEYYVAIKSDRYYSLPAGFYARYILDFDY